MIRKADPPPFNRGDLVRYLPTNHTEIVERCIPRDVDGRREWHLLTSWHRNKTRSAKSDKFKRV